MPWEAPHLHPKAQLCDSTSHNIDLKSACIRICLSRETKPVEVRWINSVVVEQCDLTGTSTGQQCSDGRSCAAAADNADAHRPHVLGTCGTKHQNLTIKCSRRPAVATARKS